MSDTGLAALEPVPSSSPVVTSAAAVVATANLVEYFAGFTRIPSSGGQRPGTTSESRSSATLTTGQ
ncbi:hypothetical protein GCM10010483_42140 [Actinokineospora diospyrosa]